MKFRQISKLRNLGSVTEQWLNEVGISSEDDLRRVGAVEAYRLVKQAGFNPSLNLLYALHGALIDKDCRMLTVRAKKALQKSLGLD